MTTRRLVFASCSLLLAAAAQAAVDSAYLAEHGLDPVPGAYLVTVDDPAAREAVRIVVQAAGGRVAAEHAIVPDLISVEALPPEHAEVLSTLPGVSRVRPDYWVSASLAESVPLIGGLDTQLASAGFSGIDGSGVRVCVADTGVRASHIVFEGRVDVGAGWDFANGDANANDDNGHGTHVASVAAGGNGFTLGSDPFQGVAFEATVVPVKVLNASGQGTVSWIVSGIDHCVNAGQADVINLSLGGGVFQTACDGDSIAQAANNAAAAGLVVVAASGNDCLDTAMSSPACGTGVLAVGATWDSPVSRGPRFGCLRGSCADKDAPADTVHCFSNGGSQLDVVAPGGPITGASISADDSVTTYYGTSQASPHVAGLAALLLDQDPSRTPADVRLAIRGGAVDLLTPGWDAFSGAGRIDVQASLGGGSGGCGDGTCDAGESACGCPADCGVPPAQETDCSDGLDEDCDGLTDCDDIVECATDPACGTCGDGTCDSGEGPCDCPQDCGLPATTETDCGNGVDDDCDGAVDGADPDCAGGITCGDGVCEGGSENCETCPSDCREARRGVDCCGDGVCSGSENIHNCPIDCGGF